MRTQIKTSELIRNIGGGMAVGIANIIPGVSGGTMLVILGLFDRLMDSISDIFRLRSQNRKGAILFLLQVLIGAGVGLVGFANVVEWLFSYYDTQTFYWFIGLVLFSIPSLLRNELKGNRIAYPYLFTGIVIIAVIAWLSPERAHAVAITFPDVTLAHLLFMLVVGIVAGATMLFPGVSGSMVLLIIGQYYLFRSYVADITTFEMNILIPVAFIGMGICLGVLISAKLTSFLLHGYRKQTVSFILGLILASAVALIPLNVSYDLTTILTSTLAFIIGGAMVLLIDRHA